jgi:hypothetical protein
MDLLDLPHLVELYVQRAFVALIGVEMNQRTQEQLVRSLPHAELGHLAFVYKPFRCSMEFPAALFELRGRIRLARTAFVLVPILFLAILTAIVNEVTSAADFEVRPLLLAPNTSLERLRRELAFRHGDQERAVCALQMSG